VQDAADLPELTAPDALPQDWGAHWLSPDLALSQTCGLPFRTRLKGRVQYVATFDYGLGGPLGHYVSHHVVRADREPAFQPQSLAYNAADSQSGWAAAEDRQEYTRLIKTGAHEASARYVAGGKADAAYIDAVTWRLLEAGTNITAQLKITHSTRPTPGLPLITALGTDPTPLRRALQTALGATSGADRAAMGGVSSLTVLDPAEYYAIEIPPAPVDPA
jgi:hypothetical protein